MCKLNKRISIFYRADLYEDETIQLLLKYKPPWDKELESMNAGKSERFSGTVHVTVFLRTVIMRNYE